MIDKFINDNTNEINIAENLFKDILNSKKTIKEDDFFLVILKKWNSASPKYPLNRLDDYKNYFKYDYTCGGGFFVVLGGYGLVIDPGYRFLETFYENGFVPRDIDGIFVSHAHEDHCIDLEPIFSVLYKTNKRAKELGDSEIKFDLFINSTTQTKFEQMFLNDKDLIQNKLITDNQQSFNFKNKKNNEIFLEFIRTQHKEEPWNIEGYGRGLKIGFNDKVILYSSDTEYYTPFDINKESKFDILILNIGKLGSTNYLNTLSHLGLKGIQLINEQFLKKSGPARKPIIIISEMGFELEKKRIELIQTLRDHLKSINNNILIQVIYSEPGTIIDLNYENIISRITIHFHEIEKFNDIKEELKYYSKECLLEPPIQELDDFNHNIDKIVDIVDPNIIENEDENFIFLPNRQCFFYKDGIKKIEKIIFSRRESLNFIDALKSGYSSIDELKDYIEKEFILPDDQYITLVEYENLRNK